MEKLTKLDAGYIHLSGTNYTCHDCIAWLDHEKRCALVWEQHIATANDTSRYFMKGPPGALLGINAPYTLFDIGFMRTPYGAGCKRCEYFNTEAWKCEKVDENSEGPDPGMIHPDACCDFQQPDTVRSFLDDDELSNLIAVPTIESGGGPHPLGTSFNPIL